MITSEKVTLFIWNPTIFNIIGWVDHLIDQASDGPNNTWNIRRLVNESIVLSFQRPRTLYWRLLDFAVKETHNFSIKNTQSLIEVNLKIVQEQNIIPDHLYCLTFLVFSRGCQLLLYPAFIFQKATWGIAGRHTEEPSLVASVLHHAALLNHHWYAIDRSCKKQMFYNSFVASASK